MNRHIRRLKVSITLKRMKNNYVIINAFLLRFFTGDMQLIAEIYDVLKELAGLDNPQMADVFAEWNKGMHLAIFLLVYLC